jgi:hypothetical protein
MSNDVREPEMIHRGGGGWWPYTVSDGVSVVDVKAHTDGHMSVQADHSGKYMVTCMLTMATK